ncbi:major head protein [Idiomarinaceae phage Phi1M2-2]|uniref:major head protein n=1 Tax=Idiomarinaceae phage Phi1M2-2 TaxID=1527515 RepID=UPI0004F8136C|nr:major head protein [Idiomarinaceae phage Phi1M2-2]AIM40765.1 putative capsid coat protein [Idiomarinaceae phage Phi1M2-2]
MNTLNDLIPSLYQGLDIVSRELVGAIPSVALNTGAERAAVGQSVRVPITGEANVDDISPAMVVPEPTAQSVDNAQILITKARAAEFGVIGEEQRGLNANGAGWENVQAGMFAQALRKLVNEVELDTAQQFVNASRAYENGATPFNNTDNLEATAQLHKILADNGSPLNDKQLVIDTTRGAQLRNLYQLTRANEAGGDSMLRQGVLLDIHGFSIRESAGVRPVTAGTADGDYTVTAAQDAGATTFAVAGGTGDFVQGDVVSFAGHDSKYIVQGFSGGELTIASPGLVADVDAGAAIAVDRAGGSIMGAFDRNAIQLVTRAPALPNGQDMAQDSMMITDDRSGLTFEVRVYYGYRKVRYEVALAWGVSTIKPEHMAALVA